MWKIFCAFFLGFAMVEGVPPTPSMYRYGYCNTDSDCDIGECCQILSKWPVISRKRGTGGNATCQRYQKLYENCFPFDEDNGYCSCEPGTRCTFRLTTTAPPPTTSTTLLYPETTTWPHESPYPRTTGTWYRKKRLLEEGGTYECQPI